MQDRLLADTLILLHGGDYVVNFDGSFNSTFRTRGSDGHPAVIAQAPGETATLKLNGVNWWPAWIVAGEYVWFVGFRITAYDASDRITATCGSSPGNDMSHYGGAIKVREDLGPRRGIKMINLQLDNNLEGIQAQNGMAPDLEVYGCNIFYNGWQSTCDGEHGHGIYPQSPATGGTMRFLNVIPQNNMSNGFHAYGSSATYQDDMELVGDFSGNARNATIAGNHPAMRNKVHDSSFYAPTNSDSFHFGWTPWPLNAATGTSFLNNLFAGGLWLQQKPGVTIAGNTFRDPPADPYAGYTQADFPNNTWGSAPSKVFVRPNIYEAGRGSVAIYNPGNLLTFPVDISPIVASGASYQIRYSLAPQAAPILSGIYSGGTVGIPMSGYGPVAPAGNLPAPTSALPGYGVFIVTSGGVPSSPTPSVTAAPPGTPTSTPSLTASVTSTLPPSTTPTVTKTNTPVFTWTPLATKTHTATKTKTSTKTRTPTPQTICVTATPVCVKVTVTP